MATSVYFNGAVRSEQNLYEDLVLESIKMFGQDIIYMPREQIYEDAILNETLNQYRHAYPIECFIENVEGFEGDGNLLGKFGLEIRDQGTFIIPKKRWDHVVGMNLAEGLGNQVLTQPGEGDLIYMPMTDRIFEIKYVEPKSPFYQLQDLPSYQLTAELFEYNDQNFDTGVPEIDNIELLYANAYSYTTNASANTNAFVIGEYVHQWTGSTDDNGANINIISKVAGFELTRNYREAYNIFACSGILFNHESPRRGFEFVTRKISSSVARIKLGLQKELNLGNIDAQRDWGHAEDYVVAMWKMLQQKKPEDFVIGTGKMHSVKDFAKLAFQYVGLNYKDYIKIDKKLIRPAEVDVLCAQYKKAAKILKWKPLKKFKDLVNEMVDSDLSDLK